MRDETLPADRSPEARARIARGAGAVVVALYLALQIVLPLSYYLSNHADDERFAWRMFSSIALRNCVLSVEESTVIGGVADRRVLNLNGEIQARWIGVLETNHARAVQKFLRHRCELSEVRGVRLVRTCTESNGARVPLVEHVLDCAATAPGRPA